MAPHQHEPSATAKPAQPERAAPAEDLKTAAPAPQIPARLLAPQQILQLQRTMGNRAVSRSLQGRPAPRPVAAPAIQRRLVPIETFKTGKAAATTTTLLRRPRSTADVEKIYTAYAAAIAGPAPNWTLADKQLDLLDAKLIKMATKTYWKEGAAAPFLAAQRAGLNQERIWLDTQRYARLAANPTAVPEAHREVIKVYMEQGMAAPLNRFQLHSTQFSTCSPVVLFNAGTRVGGLFHYGAKALEDQRASLRQLIAVVSPTEIHVLLGGGNLDLEHTPFTEDQAPLRTFFETTAPTANLVVSDEQYHAITVTLGADAGLSIEAGTPAREDYNTGSRPDATPAGTQFIGKKLTPEELSLWQG